jgi:hypothetical protein
VQVNVLPQHLFLSIGYLEVDNASFFDVSTESDGFEYCLHRTLSHNLDKTNESEEKTRLSKKLKSKAHS